MTELRKLFVSDEVSGTTANVEANGGLAVNVQDQTTQTIDTLMLQADGPPAIWNPNATMTAGGTSFVVGSATSLAANNELFIAEAGAIQNASYHVVSSVDSAATDTVHLKVPIPNAYTTSANIFKVTADMAGSSTGTRTSPDMWITANNGTVSYDITRIILQMVTNSSPELTDFGDIAGGLTNGCVLRHYDVSESHYHNICYWRDNADIMHHMYDVALITGLGAGDYGLTGRMTFGGASKHGVVIRMDPGDELQFLIQDDISALDHFDIMVQGHYVDAT
jgi:hypothetical protein